MVILRIQHAVPSFEAWKRAFDSDPIDRRGGGVRRYRVHRSVADPKLVSIDLEFDTVDEAQLFLQKLERLWSGPGKAVMIQPRELDARDGRVARAVTAPHSSPAGIQRPVSETRSNLCPIMSFDGQLRLKLRKPRTHGGERKGAGRRPAGERAGVSHHGRADVTKATPVHATLRVLSHVWNLRSGRSLAVIEAAISGMSSWREFRVVHFSAQGDHLHFIVEADDNRALSKGMQGLSVRLAKGLNRMMGRRGKVLADRYHAHVLRTPSETRNALAYVLLNHRSHMLRIGERTEGGPMDRFSSAATLDGWRDAPAAEAPRVTSAPQSWLLREGWKRRGLLSTRERPGVGGPRTG